MRGDIARLLPLAGFDRRALNARSGRGSARPLAPSSQWPSDDSDQVVVSDLLRARSHAPENLPWSVRVRSTTDPDPTWSVTTPLGPMGGTAALTSTDAT